MRIQKNAAEVAVALDALIFGDALPGRAAIIGAVEAAFLAFRNNQEHTLSARRDGHAHASKMRFRKLWDGDRLPGLSAVGRFVDARAAGAKQSGKWRVGIDVVVPERGEPDLRIIGRKGHINGASLVVLVEHLTPGL